MKIDYVEFGCEQFEASQRFFEQVFGWRNTDYGPDYQELQQAGLGVGMGRAVARAPLLVLKCRDLEQAYAPVKAAGVVIAAEMFDFLEVGIFHFWNPTAQKWPFGARTKIEQKCRFTGRMGMILKSKLDN